MIFNKYPIFRTFDSLTTTFEFMESLQYLHICEFYTVCFVIINHLFQRKFFGMISFIKFWNIWLYFSFKKNYLNIFTKTIYNVTKSKQTALDTALILPTKISGQVSFLKKSLNFELIHSSASLIHGSASRTPRSLSQKCFSRQIAGIGEL